jgi:hypothetical protein
VCFSAATEDHTKIYHRESYLMRGGENKQETSIIKLIFRKKQSRSKDWSRKENVRMKGRYTILFPVIVFTGILMLITFGSNISILPGQTGTASNLAFAQPGHGGPSGPHYNLNLIGVPKDKTADMKGGHGHRIFLKLWGNSRIWLNEGDDFQVLDANGTDQDGAKFQLPDPDPDDDLVLAYSVWARALGKPGGKSRMLTCYQDEFGDEYCSVDTLKFKRSKGQSKFRDVSKELLTLCFEYDTNGKCIGRAGIFDEELWQYFWDYNNQGLKLVQLRFYPISVDVSGQ